MTSGERRSDTARGTEPPLQQRWFPEGGCFGCGPANADGLRLESFADGDEVVAVWSPAPRHRAGPEVVAGGVVGTLLDCHTGAAVLKAVGERDGKTPYVDGPPWVTRSYEISLCRPTPLDRPIELRAGVIELHDDRAVADSNASRPRSGHGRRQAGL